MKNLRLPFEAQEFSTGWMRCVKFLCLMRRAALDLNLGAGYISLTFSEQVVSPERE